MAVSTSSQSSAPGEDQEYFYEWSKQQIQKLAGVDKPLPKELKPYKFVLHYSGDDETSYGDLFSQNGFSSVQRDEIYQNMVSLEYQKYTVFNDPIHGTIQLHPLLTKITKTRAFDRLKHIKQLAGVHYVYPGATHTRFEHSIGTCYIAGEFARMLQRQQPELGITNKTVLCVEIAGLCHDLGHGCFSHLFEKDVMKSTVFRDFLKEKELKWKHEEMSTRIFEKCIWEDKVLKNNFKEYGFEQEDLEFIKKLINHEDFEDIDDSERYLYEIVANKATGIDVDKWDYFARDCHYLGIPNEFQWRRLMALSRVVTIEQDKKKQKRIVYRSKEVHNIYGMFRTRSSLHQKAYQHKTVIGIEHMIALAVVKTKDIKLLRTSTGDFISVSQAVENALKCKEPSDLDGFLALTDAIFYQILFAQQPEDLKPEEAKQLTYARELLERIPERNIFHQVHVNTCPGGGTTIIDEELAKEFGFTVDDVYVRTVKISYGSERQDSQESKPQNKDFNPCDPVNNVWFYRKELPWEPNKGTELTFKSKLMVPKEFVETEERLYSGLGKKKLDKDKVIEAYKKARK